MLNRLNVRLLVAFSTILIVTLCIMWVALLLVLRAQPPNTDSEAIDLSCAFARDKRTGSRALQCVFK